MLSIQLEVSKGVAAFITIFSILVLVAFLVTHALNRREED